jgi:hypothetical protein
MFMKVYEMRGDKTPQWNADDFFESFWLWPWEIMDRVQAGERTKDDLPVLVDKFYARQVATPEPGGK